MKVAELLSKRNAKVRVRVPVSAQKEHGLKRKVTGKVVRVTRDGRLARATVLVGRSEFVFRPQDLSPA